MKLCIDPGHGHSSRTPGVFDPGATNQAFREADIVLRYGMALDIEATRRGWETLMTRRDNTTPAPLMRRVKTATDARCNLLISLHVNAAHISRARGIETLYCVDHRLATNVQHELVKATGLLDRGPKYRDDLAVLRFKNSALVELGFITNAFDLAVLMQPEMPAKVAAAICDALNPLSRQSLEV